MVFGLFKKKFATTVNPQVGATLTRASAYPGAVAPPPAPSYATVRNVSVDAAPPRGKLAKVRAPQPPAEAFVVDGAAGQAPLAVVNIYEDKRRTEIWQLDGRDSASFDKPRTARFDAQQSSWVMFSAESVLALPAQQLLIHLRHHKPRAADGLFIYDSAADRMRSLGEVEPEWFKGLPLRYVDSLQVTGDTLLVRYHTGKERLGPQRHVNQFDHLLLFSPRHPDGLAIVQLGLDDGNVRRWGMVGKTLWLQTSDDRGDAAREFIWSLDLGRVL